MPPAILSGREHGIMGGAPKGQVAVIDGGTRGMGSTIAKAFSREGAEAGLGDWGNSGGLVQR